MGCFILCFPCVCVDWRLALFIFLFFDFFEWIWWNCVPMNSFLHFFCSVFWLFSFWKTEFLAGFFSSFPLGRSCCFVLIFLFSCGCKKSYVVMLQLVKVFYFHAYFAFFSLTFYFYLSRMVLGKHPWYFLPSPISTRCHDI